MWPSYSPLFTSGLLADHAAPTAPAAPEDANAAPIYLTLKPTKRDSSEFRSFLYLDLADHKLNSPSLRRKFSMMTKSSSWSCTADAKSFYDLTRTENTTIVTSPVSPAGPARRRASKESLRNIPSPKPAPSATLPDLPIASDFPAPPSALPSRSSKKRPASIVTPLLPSPTARRRPSSLRSESISSHVRRKGRMDALARLEGRTPGSALRNNFMSFSDDEDEKSTRKSSAASAFSPVIQIDDLSEFADVEDEAEAIVPKRVASLKVSKSPRHGRRRRTTLDTWFPLKSFMDLKDDDLSSWNWRSFIEIGGVA